MGVGDCLLALIGARSGVGLVSPDSFFFSGRLFQICGYGGLVLVLLVLWF
jgi:hypothetical protein